MESIAEAYARFLRSQPEGPPRYDSNLFEAFLEREGLSPHAWGEDELMGFFTARLGLSRSEAREFVERLGEWGPRAPG